MRGLAWGAGGPFHFRGEHRTGALDEASEFARGVVQAPSAFHRATMGGLGGPGRFATFSRKILVGRALRSANPAPRVFATIARLGAGGLTLSRTPGTGRPRWTPRISILAASPRSWPQGATALARTPRLRCGASWALFLLR